MSKTKLDYSENGKAEKADPVDTEMRTLERDLARMDEKDLTIQDDYRSTIDALLVLLQGDARIGAVGMDEQRAQLRQRIAIAIELKEREEAKNLKAAYEKLMKKMHAALRRLVTVLASDEAQGIRENMANWQHVRANLRTVIIKSLKIKHDIDLGEILARVEVREAELRAEALREVEEELELVPEEIEA